MFVRQVLICKKIIVKDDTTFFFLISLSKTIILFRGQCETKIPSFMENWNNILSWRKKCPYSSNMPSIWGLAAPLRHYLVFHYDPLIIFKNFVYGKSLLFMPLVSSLNSSSCIYSSFTLRSLILCVLPDINKNWVFYNEECTFNKIIKILILISGPQEERGK